ncbi:MULTISPECIES: hypothetical protein [Nocardia]|uniref:hypothetical protein n=1 Tax=Nocardia TaxID=1817 RepID=UPI000D68EA63|nr:MULTISPECIES: hypothetical protein [Nocardia]
MTTTVYAFPANGLGREQLVPDVCDVPLGPQQACEQLGQAAQDAAGSVIDELSDAMAKGFAFLLRLAIGWWTDLPAPELTAAGGEPGPALMVIRDYSGGLQVLLLTTGIIFAAARLALAKRGGVAGEAQESFLMLARAVFASMVFAAVITLGTRAGDQFADWVIFDASRGDLTGAVDRVTQIDSSTVGLGSGLLLVVALLGVISTLVQLVMLVIRQALLILVVAVIPLAAAASGTGPGSQAYKKLLSWSLAFVLYKPVGALVYAIAFTVIGTEKQTDPQQILLGLILLVMAVVVLPALVRLVAPAVATLGGGGGATAVMAGGLAGVAMGSAGESGGARKVSEGENAPGGTGTGDGGGGGSGGSGPPPGGGGRPMSGGSGASDEGSPGSGSSSLDSGGGNGGSRTSGGTARPSSAVGKTSEGSGAGAAAGSGGEAGGASSAAAGGVAGAAMMAAQAVKDAGTQAVSAVEAQTADAAEGGWNADSLSPGEVRR